MEIEILQRVQYNITAFDTTAASLMTLKFASSHGSGTSGVQRPASRGWLLFFAQMAQLLRPLYHQSPHVVAEACWACAAGATASSKDPSLGDNPPQFAYDAEDSAHAHSIANLVDEMWSKYKAQCPRTIEPRARARPQPKPRRHASTSPASENDAVDDLVGKEIQKNIFGKTTISAFFGKSNKLAGFQQRQQHNRLGLSVGIGLGASLLLASAACVGVTAACGLGRPPSSASSSSVPANDALQLLELDLGIALNPNLNLSVDVGVGLAIEYGSAVEGVGTNTGTGTGTGSERENHPDKKQKTQGDSCESKPVLFPRIQPWVHNSLRAVQPTDKFQPVAFSVRPGTVQQGPTTRPTNDQVTMIADTKGQAALDHSFSEWESESGSGIARSG
jgi:hypothetical protein